MERVVTFVSSSARGSEAGNDTNNDTDDCGNSEGTSNSDSGNFIITEEGSIDGALTLLTDTNRAPITSRALLQDTDTTLDRVAAVDRASALT